MHVHATLMDVALSNVTGWVTTIDQDTLLLRTHPTDVSKVEEIVRLADAQTKSLKLMVAGCMTRMN